MPTCAKVPARLESPNEIQHTGDFMDPSQLLPYGFNPQLPTPPTVTLNSTEVLNYSEKLAGIITRTLQCLHKDPGTSLFLQKYAAFTQKGMKPEVLNMARSIEILRQGLEELSLGDLMAFEGSLFSLQDESLWKRKIEKASQDRGILSINAPIVTDDSFQYFLKALPSVRQVKILCIDAELNESQFEWLADVLVPQSSKEPISITDIVFNMDKKPSVSALTKMFDSIGRNPNIQRLSFNFEIDDSNAEQLEFSLRNLSLIKSASIHYPAFMGKGMQSLVKLLHQKTSLHTLKLDYCSSQELIELFKALNQSGLSTLDLGKYCELTPEAIKCLTAVVKANTTLTYLYLRNNAHENQDLLKALSCLQEAIVENTHLKQAYLPDYSLIKA